MRFALYRAFQLLLRVMPHTHRPCPVERARLPCATYAASALTRVTGLCLHRYLQLAGQRLLPPLTRNVPDLVYRLIHNAFAHGDAVAGWLPNPTYRCRGLAVVQFNPPVVLQHIDLLWITARHPPSTVFYWFFTVAVRPTRATGHHHVRGPTTVYRALHTPDARTTTVAGCYYASLV